MQTVNQFNGKYLNLLYVQCDQLNMAVCFWNKKKSNTSQNIHSDKQLFELVKVLVTFYCASISFINGIIIDHLGQMYFELKITSFFCTSVVSPMVTAMMTSMTTAMTTMMPAVMSVMSMMKSFIENSASYHSSTEPHP